MATAEIIQTMVERLVRGFAPLQILLFGSHARGTATDASDVDLLVVVARVEDRRALAVAMRRSLGDLPAGKDLLVATPEELRRTAPDSPSVLGHALREGILLHERA